MPEFRGRFDDAKRAERHGDTARAAKNYTAAIKLYGIAGSLYRKERNAGGVERVEDKICGIREMPQS